MGSYWDHKYVANRLFVITYFLIIGLLWIVTDGMGLFRYLVVTSFGILGLLIGYPAIRLGAMFPDVDHPSSIPFRRVMRAIPVIGFALGAVWHINDEDVETNTGGIMAAGIFGAVFARVFRRFYQKGFMGRRIRPKHRGPTHELKTGRILSGGLLRGIWSVFRGLGYSAIGLMIATVFASFFYLGHLSHLLREGPPKRTRPK